MIRSSNQTQLKSYRQHNRLDFLISRFLIQYRKISSLKFTYINSTTYQFLCHCFRIQSKVVVLLFFKSRYFSFRHPVHTPLAFTPYYDSFPTPHSLTKENVPYLHYGNLDVSSLHEDCAMNREDTSFINICSWSVQSHTFFVTYQKIPLT